MKKYKNNIISGGGLLIGALMATNFLNFLFNAILGRTLTLEQFSILTLANTLWFLITIFFNSLASTTNNRTAYLSARRGEKIAAGFRKFVTKKSLLIALVFGVLWILMIPVFVDIFHTHDYVLFLSMVPVIPLGIFAAVNRGYFQGSLIFAKAAIIILAESVSKLIFALTFIYVGLESLAYLSIPLAIVFTAFVTWLFILRIPDKKTSYQYIFPRKLLFATFLTIFSSAAFLSVDLLLARHFLSANESGAYSLLSLVGKMVYFLGSILNVFILTFASRDTGLNKNSAINFYKILGANIILLVVGFVGLGILGHWIVPILLGEKSVVILPYLTLYTMAIVFFTVANSFATYHLAKHQYIFAYNGIVSTLIAVIGVFIFHGTIESFVEVILATSFIYLSINMIFHILYKDVSEYVDEEDTVKYSGFNKVKAKPISVSICLPAYNEAKNIGKLLRALLKQETKHIQINRIVVVSSASTDKTDAIVSQFAKKHSQIKLIREKKRRGKACAINAFLKRVKDPVVVVQSADTIPEKDAIEKLCRPFLVDKHIGMTGGAPIPVNNPNTFLGYVIHTWWWFHRNIPRFGEIIAFRNIIPEVSPRTAVDEAYIQAKFAQLGYKIVHVDEARIHNKGSENMKDIIKQRRRIFNGHTRLMQEENVHISHMTKSGLKLLIFEYKMYGPSQLLWLMGGIMIEFWAGILGRYDKYFNKVNPVVWDIAKSTKDLSVGQKGGKKKLK